MIHSFSCKNFCSFNDLVEVSFAVNDKAPDNNGYFRTPAGVRLSKAETIIGPNASGKTNLLKVIPFLKWLIVDSFNVNPMAPIPVQPFKFGDSKNKPTELSVVFEMDSEIYLYEFSLNNLKILAEKLKIKSKSKERLTYKTIFTRIWDDKNNRYSFDGHNFSVPKNFENLLRSNASVIALASRLNHKLSQNISQYWQRIETNVNESGWIGNSLLPKPDTRLLETLDFYSDNGEIKKKAEKLLSRFDLGLEAFDIKKEKRENNLTINVQVVHSIDGQKFYLPIQYESAGTMQLFILLKSILRALESGGIVIWDEFDTSLHPEMVSVLYDLFVNSETNPNNAQLLFSTHSLSILSNLDKYQVVFTEKDAKGKSESWRLDEVTGVRPDDNYYSKYMAGTYGATPKIN